MNNLNQQIVRKSTVELLRLICMLFITCHHFLYWAITKGNHSDSYEMSSIFYGVNGFIYIGVNCFVLISGYFLINCSARGFLKLYIYCAIYSLIFGVLNSYMVDHNLYSAVGFMPELQNGNILSVKELLFKTLLVFSHNDYWFISCYLALFLMAPFLNAAINNMTRKQYLIVLVLFTIVNEYFGYFWKGPYYNVDGFNVAHFVYLYLIGGYIGRFVSLSGIRKRRWIMFGGYLTCSLLYGLLSILALKHYVPHWDGWKYNNPVLMAGAIAFFLLFLSFDFQSKCINHIAKSSLGIYLAQGLLYGLYPFIGWISSIISGESLTLEALSVLPLAMVFMILVIVFDQLRIIVQGKIISAYDRALLLARRYHLHQ